MTAQPNLSLHPDETILLQKSPDTKWPIQAAMAQIILMIFLCLLFIPRYTADLTTAVELFLLVTLVYGFFAFVILNFARRQIFYTLTTQRCIVTSTFILTKKNFIPYNRIADVNLNQNLIERCLGLARVVLYTQGDNKKTPKLVGMRFNDAEELFNRVNLILNKKSEDLV